MTTVTEVMRSLKAKGSEQTRRIFRRHGASGDLYGVKIADLKGIAKSIQGDQELACALYDTGNYDAMYLAGLVADGKRMSKKQLDAWARNASWQMISEYAVPWVATESEHGTALASKWIGAKKEHVAAAGWNTWAGIVTTVDDADLDLKEVEGLLERVRRDLDAAPNRVRYCMNAFVISVGAYVNSLSKKAKATAKAIGKVDVDMGGTACKVPSALEYIVKIEKSGRAGKKRKTVRC